MCDEAELERLREENDWWNNHFPGEEEVARLHRIEEAAREFLDYCDNCGGTGNIATHPCSWCGALRAALEEK